MRGIVESLLEGRARYQVTSARNPAYWVQKLFGGTQSATGLSITPDVAMKYSAIYGAIKIISEDVATLPLPIYRRQGEAGRVKDYEHPLYAVLNRKPNPEMTSLAFRETLEGHKLLRGNGYAEVVRDNFGRVCQMWPLRTDRMRKVRNGQNGCVIEGAPANQLAFVYALPDGSEKLFAPELIFNLRNFGPDGITGYDLVTLAAEAIGIGLATEQYSATFFGNGATPPAYITHPGKMSDPAFDKFDKSWAKAHEGLSNAHRMAILEDGMEIKTIGIDPSKSALIESRKFQIMEVCRYTRLPATMLGELGDATYSNVDHLSEAYVKFTLRSTLKRWEAPINADLLGDTNGQTYAEHIVDELLRGTPEVRASFYQSMRQGGNMTANQVADRENLPRSQDPVADQLLVPLNMAPASAYDENGMTIKDRYEIAAILVAKGFDPADTMAQLNLAEIKHSGVVPSSLQLTASK